VGRKQPTPWRALQASTKMGELVRLRFLLLTGPWLSRRRQPWPLLSLVVVDRKGAGALGEGKQKELLLLLLLPLRRRRQTPERPLVWRPMPLWLESSEGVGLWSRPRPLLPQETLWT